MEFMFEIRRKRGVRTNCRHPTRTGVGVIDSTGIGAVHQQRTNPIRLIWLTRRRRAREQVPLTRFDVVPVGDVEHSSSLSSWIEVVVD